MGCGYGSYSVLDAGCGAPISPNLVPASSKVVLILTNLSEETMLPPREPEDGLFLAYPVYAGVSFLVSPVSMVAQFSASPR